MYDVIIAGGGIAGLSAALILGRCRRRVLVCDSGRPRNVVTKALHGFLSRDGISPLELRRLATAELSAYPSVTLLEGEVVDAEPLAEGYRITLADGRSFSGGYLLIATGVVDKLPEVEGVQELYGKNIFHCPYCDGWELRDQPLAVYGAGQEGADFALELTGWSRDIVLCTDGGALPSPEERRRLERQGVVLRGERITRFQGVADGAMTIVFSDGGALSRQALFFSPDQYQASPLAEKLGCSVTPGGVVSAGKFQQVHPRLFVSGDAARSVQLAIVAAAEGAEAAFAMNSALQKEYLDRNQRGNVM